MAGLGHEKFEAALEDIAGQVAVAETALSSKRGDLKRVARAAHAAGMTERDIAKVTHRSGPAVHAWLHSKDANGQD